MKRRDTLLYPGGNSAAQEQLVPMTKILIVYYSLFGHIHRMAEAVALGVRDVPGCEAVLRRVPETLPQGVPEKMGAGEFQKEFKKLQKDEAKLNNPNFTQKAPQKVLDEQKQRLSEWQSKRAIPIGTYGLRMLLRCGRNWSDCSATKHPHEVPARTGRRSPV